MCQFRVSCVVHFYISAAEKIHVVTSVSFFCLGLMLWDCLSTHQTLCRFSTICTNHNQNKTKPDDVA
jgi:hypothetical protein